MHRRLGRAGGAGGEAQQRHVVAPGLHRLELHGLRQRQPVQLGVVVGGAVEAHDRLQKGGCPWRRRSSRPSAACRTARMGDLGLVDDLGSSPARSIGMVLTTTAPALVAASQPPPWRGCWRSGSAPGCRASRPDPRPAHGPAGWSSRSVPCRCAAAVADQRGVSPKPFATIRSVSSTAAFSGRDSRSRPAEIGPLSAGGRLSE
jgi:hypothetical protein